jgi:hypothetical protein
MRLLLDECLPKDLAQKLPGHTVLTVSQAGWAGINNGKLLRLIANSGKVDVFLTVDKRLPQQHLSPLPYPPGAMHSASGRTEILLPSG